MLERQDIVIFGTGGHARVLHDIALDCSVFTVLGFVAPTADAECLGLPALSDDRIAAAA